MPTEVPPSPPGDGAAAQAILRELEAQPPSNPAVHEGATPAEAVSSSPTHPEAAQVTAEPVKSAKRALERARGARAAGDEPHARMLDALALEWAQTARDLLRAAAAEATATATAKKAYEAQTQADRARALLEETQARRGRAAAELVHVEAEAKEAAKSAADAEAHRLEVGRRKGASPEPAAKPPPQEKAASPARKGAK